jgi:transposase
MVRRQLRDEPWSRVERALLSQQRTGRRGRDDRNVIEAVLWWRRTGVPRRDLPEEFGSWKTVFNRFDRGSKDGRWSRLFEALRVHLEDECTFNLLKQARRFATRYEKTLRAKPRTPWPSLVPSDNSGACRPSRPCPHPPRW